MDADRTEMHNLAADQAALVGDLSARWQKWADRVGVLHDEILPHLHERDVRLETAVLVVEGDLRSRGGLRRIALAGIQPDDVQRSVLTSNARRGILNCCRQWGKSTISAAKALHRALTVPDSLILILSPCARQSAEFVRKVRRFASSQSRPLWAPELISLPSPM